MKAEPEWEDIVALFAMHAMMSKAGSTTYDDIAECAYKMSNEMMRRFHKSERVNDERQTD
jgi:hypothetical protein